MRIQRRYGLMTLTAIAAAAACTAPSAVDLSMARAADASAAGQWDEAFLAYAAVIDAEPTLAAAQAGLEDAADELLERVPGVPVAAEVALLRWLGRRARWEDVAAVLDASTVSIAVAGSESGETYEIDRYEVTNLQYARFVDDDQILPPAHWNGVRFPPGAADHPVVGVSWSQADAYCRSVDKRLPTEAEWEHACQGTEGWTYPWGDEWDPDRVAIVQKPLADPDAAWQWLRRGDAATASPSPVGEPASGTSPFGVCNLADNAAEWVDHGDGPADAWNHPIRGGAWLFRHADTDLMSDHSRCSFRTRSHSADDPRVGFRCARSGRPVRPQGTTAPDGEQLGE
jgi:hypothetical protein